MQVAEIDEVGDRAGGVEQAVEWHGRSGLEEVTRRDEDQLTTGLQVAQTFFNEKQVEVGASVEEAATRQVAGCRRDLLITDIRGVADDRGELLGVGQFEEIHHQRFGWGMAGIDLDAGGPGKVLQEGAVATRRLEHTAPVAHQAPHAIDNRRRSKHLPQRGDVVTRVVQRVGHWRHGSMLKV